MENKGTVNGDNGKQLTRLREEAGMNRKEFGEYFGIPYRTLTDWELEHRAMPDYVLRLIAYQVKTEKLGKKK